MPAPLPAVDDSYAARSLLHYARPDVFLRDLHHFRDLLRQFIKRGVEERYQGSYLGILWALITPLAMLATYTFVFAVLFKSPGPDLPAHSKFINYALMLFMGLIVFNVFSECATAAPYLIIRNPNYVKKVVFPLEILPFSQVGAAVIHSFISLLVLLAAQLAVAHDIPWTIFYLPLYYLPLIFFTLGISWVLASLGVFLRDIGHLMVVVVQLLMFLSPIFYPVDIIPKSLRPIYNLNPLTIVVEGFRRTVLWNQAPDWIPWIAVTAGGLVVMLGSYAWFMKLKPAFADVI